MHEVLNNDCRFPHSLIKLLLRNDFQLIKASESLVKHFSVSMFVFTHPETTQWPLPTVALSALITIVGQTTERTRRQARATFCNFHSEAIRRSGKISRTKFQISNSITSYVSEKKVWKGEKVCDSPILAGLVRKNIKIRIKTLETLKYNLLC